MSLKAQITKSIKKFAEGVPFASMKFFHLGSRANIDQILSRLTKTGEIVRIARGLYMRPKKNRYVGNVAPEPAKVAQALAELTGSLIQVHGAVAANQLKITTQVPSQLVFHTNGPSRKVRMGNLQLALKHVSPRKLTLAERPAGLAIAALWYLGKQNVTHQVLSIIEKNLQPQEFKIFRAGIASMPTWMANKVRNYEGKTK